ncbi:hypothetical protein ACMX2H_11490 [Arthrobacter sulfonylureivorans]|uniref:hypothetical protein n=1 Tax=Arthrobacter sulfonylureivorans TaxID=2486855 RepID=UPI0039E6C0B5
MEISAREYAEREGVSVQRVRQLIESGAVPARKVGRAWLIEASAPKRVAAAVRPFSADSVFEKALALSGEKSSVRGDRVRNWRERLASESEPESLLVAWLARRAERRSYIADSEDIADLQADPRIALSGVSHPAAQLSSGREIEGYVEESQAKKMVREFLLRPAADGQGNVVLHVAKHKPERVPELIVAADLADRGGYREREAARRIIREVVGK